MTWLKLPNAGDSATVTVKTCGVVHGDTLRFSTTDGDDLYLPIGVATDRLRDAGFTDPDFNDVLGAQLHFSRIDGNGGGRPRWMIERTKAPLANTHTNGVVKMPTPADETTNAELAKGRAQKVILDAYEAALEESLAIQRRVLKGKINPKATAESVQAGAATILIQWERNRCL